MQKKSAELLWGAAKYFILNILNSVLSKVKQILNLFLRSNVEKADYVCPNKKSITILKSCNRDNIHDNHVSINR